MFQDTGQPVTVCPIINEMKYRIYWVLTEYIEGKMETFVMGI